MVTVNLLRSHVCVLNDEKSVLMLLCHFGVFIGDAIRKKLKKVSIYVDKQQILVIIYTMSRFFYKVLFTKCVLSNVFFFLWWCDVNVKKNDLIKPKQCSFRTKKKTKTS